MIKDRIPCHVKKAACRYRYLCYNIISSSHEVNMTPYTLSLDNASTHLREAVEQARRQQAPVLILAEDGQAMAWLEPLASASAMQQKWQEAQRKAHLTMLKATIQALTSADAQPDILALCRDQLRSLYRSAVEATPAFRQVVLLLQLVLQNVRTVPLHADQALALFLAVDTLQQSVITEADVRTCTQRLLNSQLYPDTEFDDELLGQYIAEV